MRNLKRAGVIALLLLGSFYMNPEPINAAESGETFAYIGTYTGGKSKGIYLYGLDLTSGKLTPKSVTDGIKNPSFLAIHPNHKFLYAASELAKTDGKRGGGFVFSFAINGQTGELKKINSESAKGDGTCFVSVDHSGKCALAANYNDGSIAALPIKTDGSLSKAVSVLHHHGSSIDPKRQISAHAHSINVSPDNKFAVVADLGMDKLMIYKLLPEKAKLSANNQPFCATAPGAGPRHVAFSPSGKFAYVSDELSCTVTAYSWDAAKGTLGEIQSTSTLPAAVPENTVAEIQIHPSGKFLYCSNRGDDSIAMFQIDDQSGKLTTIGFVKTQGQKPRNFTIEPSGKFLVVCNQASDNVVVFQIDPSTGKLNAVGEPITVPEPVCVKFLEKSQ